MTWSLDARIPLLIVQSVAALHAELADDPAAMALEGFDASLPHAPACACCAGRTPAALALDALFQGRVRGTLPWFARIIALAESPEARAAVQTALREDALTAARFRAAPSTP